MKQIKCYLNKNLNIHFKNHYKKHFLYAFVGSLALTISACSGTTKDQPSAKQPNKDIVIANFEDGRIPDYLSTNHGSMHLVKDKNALDGKYSLNVKVQTQAHNEASLDLRPTKAWDWSMYEDFHLAFDIANFGDESVQVDIDMFDNNGDFYSRALVVPVGPAETWYAKMDGQDQMDPPWATANEFNFASGFRSNPPTWQSDDHQVFSLWGKKRLDLSAITGITFSVKGMLSDREFTIDNIRLRANPKMDKDFLVGLIDQYGQNTRVEYKGKIHSDKELAQVRDAELASLSDKAFTGRSKFNGWADGPRLKASGHFRTEKIDGQWWLVDPEGYLYLSTGIDILRLSNSSTLTGYDFDQKYVPKRSSDMLVSEDDQPLNRIADEALPSRSLASETRSKIFTWLPEYNDELGNHYGYRRETQSGPLKHGETYSFYSANLERKYGETSPESYLDTWREITLKRMRNWGFTSLGNWAQEEYYSNEQMPYVAFADIIGEFDTLSSGFDFWHGVPDPWDPRFKERAIAAVDGVAKQINNSPWCMGIFLDNEQSFGRLESDELHYGIILNTLKMDASETHAKAHFSKMMRDKYQSIQALNKAWGKNIKSWQDFEKGIDSSFKTEQQKEDYALMLSAYGDQYFGTVNRALQATLPHHLYLGSRLPVWGMPIEIVEAAGRHMDVITFNLYEEGLVPSEWQFMENIDAPALVGEFSFGSADAGHVHPGIIIAADQDDRAFKFKNYLYSVLDHPNFVGAHMFQYMDSPIPGRAYDGENYNNGMVNVTDTPYEAMVVAAKEIGEELYQRRYNQNK